MAGTDWNKACLYEVNFKGVQNWKKIREIRNANLFGVKNPPKGFREWALANGACEMEDVEAWKTRLPAKTAPTHSKHGMTASIRQNGLCSGPAPPRSTIAGRQPKHPPIIGLARATFSKTGAQKRKKPRLAAVFCRRHACDQVDGGAKGT